MAPNHQLLDQRLASLTTVPGLDARHVEHLATALKDPDDWRAFRMNPLRFAAQHGMPTGAALDLFLHATRAGLLEMRFNLLCPGCGSVEYEMKTMDAVPTKDWFCIVCQRHVPSELDDRVEVTFTPELGVRHLEVAPFGDPAQYGRFYFSENLQRAPELAAFVNTLSLGLYLVPRGTEQALDLEASPGATLRLLSVDTHSQVKLETADDGARQVEITALESGLSPAIVKVAAGPIVVRIVNRGARDIGVMALRQDWPTLERIAAAHPSRMQPFLTAKMLLNTQTFRDLFRVQTLDGDLQLRLRSLTLLFTDLKGSTELYDRTGDLRAYAFVREHFKLLSEAVKRNHGAIIKTMGDAIMASFNEPTDAAQAALEMMPAMDTLNATLEREGHVTGLKVGLHEGPALAVTSEERLDYFGQTVNVAARVQGLAQAGEIWLTPTVLDAPGVLPALTQAGWRGEPRDVSLKGVGGTTRVHRMHR